MKKNSNSSSQQKIYSQKAANTRTRKVYYKTVCVESCKSENRFVLTDPKPLTPELLKIEKVKPAA